MQEKCSVCITPKHTDKFTIMYTAILDELKRRSIPGLEDTDELAKALAILTADALEIDIYT